MSDSVLVSVVVCTHNRAAFLQKCLDSLLRQENHAPFEVIVVDNNSADRTAQTVEATRRETSIPFQYIFLQEIGLSRARNAGIDAARGDLIAFIDDDAMADVHWIQEIEKGFALYPHAVAQGGAVTGDYEIPKPAWLGADLLLAVSVGEMGDRMRLMNGREVPLGCNMAFRRQAFQRHGEFLANLGRTGASLLAAEEVEFCIRLYKQNESIVYNPKMQIKHWVPKERLTQTYIRQRMYWNGRSIARIDLAWGRSVIARSFARVFGAMPLALLKMILEFGKLDRRFFHGCMLVKQWGYLNETWILCRESISQ